MLLHTRSLVGCIIVTRESSFRKRHLAANDRVKARLSVLQAAGRHAREPQRVRFDMADECRTAGIDPAAMDMLINGASLRISPAWSAPSKQ